MILSFHNKPPRHTDLKINHRDSQENFLTPKLIISTREERFLEIGSQQRTTKNGSFFWKFTVELVWKSFSGKNTSLKVSIFLFFNSLLYGLEESRELWILISWGFGLVGIQKYKKFLPTIFLLCFWAAIIVLLITLKY